HFAGKQHVLDFFREHPLQSRATFAPCVHVLPPIAGSRDFSDFNKKAVIDTRKRLFNQFHLRQCQRASASSDDQRPHDCETRAPIGRSRASTASLPNRPSHSENSAT